jgi:2-iminobutanoate/2-iminopropanoate deaminase
MVVNRRAIFCFGLAISAGLVYAAFTFFQSWEVDAQTASKRVLAPEDAPKAIGPYSQGTVANGFIYTAGQIAIDPKTGKLIVGDTAEQTEQVLKNLEAVLRAGGGSFDDVVKTVVFLVDMNDFAKMNEVYGRYFKAPYPARSTIQVERLPLDAMVEIEALAVSKTGGDRVK